MKYLGEEIIDVKKHEKYSRYTAKEWVLLYLEMYSGVDGSHHKDWVLDQIARILKGTQVEVKLAKWDNGKSEYRFDTKNPTKEYKDWVLFMKGKIDENGDYEYDYDEGISP